MKYNPELVPDLLGPRGPLSLELAAYEDRPYQRELALEVARILEDGGRLAAEAPTGIGKSLGYGLPAAAWAVAGNGPVVISTHTKALQEQLLSLEAPRLEKAVGRALAVQVLKGRTNYLCRRRYRAACAEATGEGTVDLLRRIRPWVESTETGDLSRSGVRDPRDLQFVRARITSDPRFCAHSACTPTEGCFFKQARLLAQGANLLIVNHALLTIHLFGGYDLLPDFDALIVDEAHGFVRVALDHLTVSVGAGRTSAIQEQVPGGGGLVPPLVRDGEGASWLAALHGSMSRLESAARDFFGRKNGRPPEGDNRQRYRDPEQLTALCPLPPAPLEDALGTVQADTRALGAFVERVRAENDEITTAFLGQIRRFDEELSSVRSELTDLCRPDPNQRDRVHWKEWETNDTFTLNASPLEVGPRVAAALETGPSRLVFTSATLAAGDDFEFFAREVGMEGSLPSAAYPSPFDFREQALAIAVRRSPDPRDPGWVASTTGTLRALMRDPGRKTMALFTSYRDLRAVEERLRSEISDEEGNAFTLLAQRTGSAAGRLLEEFRREWRALLLGTSSFWEGVDLPGDDLEVLVLTRLPFGVPTDPRYEARAERLEAEGGNPFTDLYLPEAVLRFKQGFGRLIRRRTDRGVVAVLDPRLLGKGYGRRFTRALPLPVTSAADGPDLARIVSAWWREGPKATQGESP